MQKIYFGSLKDEDIQRDESLENMSGVSFDHLESVQNNKNNEERFHITEEQAGFLTELEHRRQARQAIVPTADDQVRDCLIGLGEPMTLFGEGPYERRERLKMLVADPSKNYKERLEAIIAELRQGPASGAKSVTDDREEFFVPGSEALLEFRQWLVGYSLEKASIRLASERAFKSQPISSIKESRLAAYERLKTYQFVASQVGCDRPISFGSYSPDGSQVVTGGFGGSLNIWSTSSAELFRSFAGHQSRTNCARFHPSREGIIASSSDDSTIAVWSAEQAESPLLTLKGHTAKVPRIQFHPSGFHLGSASFDHSWRLWDLEKQTELQLQEGHSRPVYSIDFNPDGSLAITGGLDSFGRVWDLRLGKSIWTLQGKHVKGLLSTKFAPNGYEIATASEDCTVRIWDLRSLTSLYTLPAHNSTISDLVWTPDGSGLVTVAYDGNGKVWARHGWKCLAQLQGHDSKIMAVDVSRSSGQIATFSYDRTFKFWQ